MPTERALDSVLQDFLETLGSDELFRLLVREWPGPLEFDLLALPPPLIAESKTAVVAEARAISSLRELMAKAGISFDTLARASLVIDRSESSRDGDRMGFEVTFRAGAEAVSGRTFACESKLFVGPHDPDRELRSARAN